MNRRTFFATASGFAVVATTSQANIFSDAWTAISGHAADAASRITAEDNYIAGETFKTGTFNEEASGQDFAHWAKGTVSVVKKDGKKYIQLGNDFNSGPLPDGWVYVSSTATGIEDEDDFYSSKQFEVGPLAQGKGAHFYEIPSDMEVKSFTIMCKAFKEYIGSADMKVI